MTDSYIAEKLKDALGQAYDRGYGNGTVNAVKALSISLRTVYGLGVLEEKDKKGYLIALETIEGTLKDLQQNNEEKGH